MKRNNLLVIVVVIAGIFLIFNPLQLFRGNQNAVQRPPVDQTRETSLVQWALAHYQSPQDYVVSTFASHDIVFLADFYKIKQNPELVSSLIPRLYAAGVRNLGIEYALSDDQAQIDALLTAPAWDEATARAITFDWLVTWGFQEYIDIYHAAWQLNHGLAAGAPPFRILGLSVRQNWEYLKTQSDMTDPTVIAKIYANGIPDAHEAEVILTQLAQKGQKALIYTSTQHAFTRYRSADYEKNAASMHFSEVRRAGNIVAAAIGSRAFTISLHSPWPDKQSKDGYGYPADGAIDALIEKLPATEQSAGWDTMGTPIGALPITTGSYAATDRTVTVADLFDGYIIQGPIGQYQVATPIQGFVRPEDAVRAGSQFPSFKATPPTVAQVNQSILDDAQALQKLLADFR